MTADELRAAIEADPAECKRCGFVACKCWEELERRVIMAPTGKANLVAMKLAYRDVWDSFGSLPEKKR